MTFTEHPRLLARIAGAFYLVITAFALFAYMHVRGQLIDTGDMARTADNIVANEQLFRIGFTAAVIVTMCNLPSRSAKEKIMVLTRLCSEPRTDLMPSFSLDNPPPSLRLKRTRA
jgi:hypothetical protein